MWGRPPFSNLTSVYICTTHDLALRLRLRGPFFVLVVGMGHLKNCCNTRCARTFCIAPLAHVTDVSKGTSGRAAERNFPYTTRQARRLTNNLNRHRSCPACLDQPSVLVGSHWIYDWTIIGYKLDCQGPFSGSQEEAS